MAGKLWPAQLRFLVARAIQRHKRAGAFNGQFARNNRTALSQGSDAEGSSSILADQARYRRRRFEEDCFNAYCLTASTASVSFLYLASTFFSNCTEALGLVAFP